MTFAIGATVAGKYRIERVLGQGGMGTVYLAQHLLLERSVALKLLRPEITRHPAATERLLREGRALARLRGTHIARVLDVEAPEFGPCFLVLEYLEGQDLNALLHDSGPLAISQALGYALQASEALAEAHQQGIVHRDIKPSNLFLTTMPDGTHGIKVIDFGISKDTVSNSELTHSRSMLGSPCYMAPEQMRAGASVDARADIWSLGVVLFELITGRLPHPGNSMLEICASILESSPKSPKLLRPELPDAVDAAVRKCLARDPAERFPTVSEFARAIAPFSGTSTERLAWIVPSELDNARARLRDAARVSSIPSEPGRTEAESPRGSRRISLRLSLVAAALVLLGAVGYLGTPGRSSSGAASAEVVVPTSAIRQTLLRPSAAVAALGVAPVLPAPSIQPTPAMSPGSKAVSRRTVAKPPAISPPMASGSGVPADPVLQYGRY